MIWCWTVFYLYKCFQPNSFIPPNNTPKNDLHIYIQKNKIKTHTNSTEKAIQLDTYLNKSIYKKKIFYPNTKQKRIQFKLMMYSKLKQSIHYVCKYSCVLQHTHKSPYHRSVHDWSLQLCTDNATCKLHSILYCWTYRWHRRRHYCRILVTNYYLWLWHRETMAHHYSLTRHTSSTSELTRI